MLTSTAERSLALKEWGSITRALDLGLQTILLRKGGIGDRGKEFQVKADNFFFFPTYEHQEKSWLKPNYEYLIDESIRFKISDQKVAIGTWARITDVIQIRDMAKLNNISEFHVWTEDFVKDRMSWNPEKPLNVVVLQVFRLPNDEIVDVTPRYRGCRSWVTLSNAISTEGSQPVLDDTEFNLQRKKIVDALKGN